MTLKRKFNRHILHPIKRALMSSDFSSEAYWKARYNKGGNSGSGSYGRLALFKADVINHFCEARSKEIESVVEFGCGDGNQLRLYNFPTYVGLDVSETAIDSCKKQYSSDGDKSFFVIGQSQFKHQFDLSISIDVIFHLVEDGVYERYMKSLFESSKKYVCIYSSNEDNERTAPHVRHRKFTDWVEVNQSDWVLIERINNIYPAKIGEEDDENTFADFFFFKRT